MAQVTVMPEYARRTSENRSRDDRVARRVHLDRLALSAIGA
jgi:hypothetical protein